VHQAREHKPRDHHVGKHHPGHGGDPAEVSRQHQGRHEGEHDDQVDQPHHGSFADGVQKPGDGGLDGPHRGPDTEHRKRADHREPLLAEDHLRERVGGGAQQHADRAGDQGDEAEGAEEG
jgi:hypothetical protein